MAAPWNDGDPQSYPYSTGGPSSGGLLDSLKSAATGLANAVGGGAANGFGLGDASSGMAGGTAQGQFEASPYAEIKKNAVGHIMGQYPGYGTFWTYDTTEGVEILPQGWLVLAGAGVALWLLLGGRR